MTSVVFSPLLYMYTQLRRIRKNAVMYMCEITQLLDTVPRQLILILKTNDLLRSAEHTLRASNHRQSFLTMSKCCLRAIGEKEAGECRGWGQRLYVVARTRWKVLVISVYELWLMWKVTLSRHLNVIF